jgi:succinyl-CoA synthetase beta subunit
VFRDIDEALWALGTIGGEGERPLKSISDLPSPTSSAPRDDGYFAARRLLSSAGVRFAEARDVRTIDDAVAAAAELGYPVAVKALGNTHKSDHGGVALNVESERALRSTLERLARQSSPEGYAIERMVIEPTSVELIVGCRRDARFGPVLLVGIGGLLAEVFRDVSVALAPVDADHAEDLLLGLRGSALLTGVRGRPPLDVRAAAEAAAAISRIAVDQAIEDVEVNPLLVTEGAAIALDARVVYSQPT